MTTNDGIILIDTLYEYASDEAIVGGLRKLRLDPAKVKYVIVSHAHGDHVGGAKLMQDRFGSRIVMGGPDWDAVEKSVNQYPNGNQSGTSSQRTARKLRSTTRRLRWWPHPAIPRERFR
ncbi:MAG TPA: MBL fold metallo-hydrolase [Burkholderiales bacterium]